MSERFDPYYKWLGISPQEQPPSYYRLLGINLLESDPQVIESAADRQMVFLRTFQTGQHVQHAQKLLNEIAQARVCLLNPSKKQAYDLTLRKPASVEPAPAPLPQARLLQPQPQAIVTDVGPANLITPSSSPIRTPSRRATSRRQPAAIFIVGAALLLAVVLGVWFQRRGEPPAVPAINPPVALPKEPPQQPTTPDSVAADTGRSSSENPVTVSPVERNPQEPSAAPSTPLISPGAELTLVCQSLDCKNPAAGLAEGVSVIREKRGTSVGTRGLLLTSAPDWARQGTQWHVQYQRSFQFPMAVFVHPWQHGHVLVSVGQIVRGKAGGSWEKTGVALNGHNIPIKNASLARNEPMIKPNAPTQVVSRVDARGKYELYVDGVLMGEAQLPATAEPLVIEHSSTDLESTEPGAEVRAFAVGEAGLLMSDYAKAEDFFREVRFGPTHPAIPAAEVASAARPNDPTPPEPATLTGPRPLPSKSELDAAEEQVRKVFRAEIEKASKPDGKLELARALAEKSEQARANPAEHYTMLKMSLDAAADAGDADLAIEVLGTIAASYEADATVVAALADIGRKTKTPEGKTRTVDAALEYIEAFLAEDKYDPASKLASQAMSLASGLGDIELRKTVKQQQDEVELLKKPSEAAEKLKQNPDDPAANLTWGKYLCLVKQDWPQGLPLLTKSADAGFRAAAELELASDKQAKQKSALGEAWLELSKKAPAADRSALVARAKFWYEDALDELVGLPKTAVERRLEELRPSPAEAAKPAVVVRKRKKDPLPGMVGRVTVDNEDAGLMVFYQPGRQLEDATLKDALSRNNIKPRSPVQVVLEGGFTVPGTTAVSVSVYFNQSCRGADVTGRMFVDNNNEVSVVSGASNISGRSLSLRLIGGKPHTIRWVVTGKDGIGSCDMRIEYYNPVTSNFENLPIFYLPPTTTKLKTKAEADLSPN